MLSRSWTTTCSSVATGVNPVSATSGLVSTVEFTCRSPQAAGGGNRQ